jgi:predicted short-subunit dehydrogenase-like oxidoreductase (DUF2520 family)
LSVTTFRLIGPGRAGLSLAAALEAVGHRCQGLVGRGEPLGDAAGGVDVLLIATPDDTVAEVAAQVAPVPTTAVLHLSGSLGTATLSPHLRRGSLHPLVPLPSPAVGTTRLRSGVTFAVAGDPVARQLAKDLGGRVVEVDDGRRVNYHAAAAIAANHVVALLGQVERVAATAGLPLDAFAGLVRAATEDALALGPRAALTGPASRGDWQTIESHRRALATLPAPRTEVAAYDAMVGLARRLRLDTAQGPGADAGRDGGGDGEASVGDAGATVVGGEAAPGVADSVQVA